MRFAARAAALFLVTIGVSPAANAQENTDQAARLFRAGSQAYAHRDFGEAARRFEAAYHLAPRGAAIYDAGLAWQEAGELTRAADDFAIAVGNADVTAEQRRDASARLKALESRVGRLLVTGPTDARVTVDDGADAALPLSTHLAPGEHSMSVAYANGTTESRTLTLSAGTEEVVRLSEPSASNASPAGSSDGKPGADKPPPSDSAATQRTLAWVSLGGTVVSSAFALYFLEQGLSALDAYEKSGDSKADLHDTAVTDRTAAQVLTGLAVALGATTVVLFVTSTNSAKASTAIRVGPASASLRVTF